MDLSKLGWEDYENPFQTLQKKSSPAQSSSAQKPKKEEKRTTPPSRSSSKTSSPSPRESKSPESSSFSTMAVAKQGVDSFLSSNSIVSRFAFLILTVFLFVLALKVGMYVIGYMFSHTKSPHLMDGMVPGNQMIIFDQDPNKSNNTTISRSINENEGMEFSWSVWIRIDNIQKNASMYRHIFSKGNDNMSDNGMMQPNNAPGLYIAPNTNALVVVMNTYQVINEEITIPDIPLNKWVHVLIRCRNTTLDVYINGSIARSIEMVGVPKQNYGNVYVALNGGFDGFISNLWYYNYALSATEIQQLAMIGPNTAMISGSNLFGRGEPNHLSLQWFYTGYGNPSTSISDAAAATPSSLSTSTK